MKVLVDTNVVLDVLLERRPFFFDASRVFAEIERGAASGLLCSTTLTTIYYVARKRLGNQVTRRQIAKLLDLFDVAVVGRGSFRQALELTFADFEDAVLHQAAEEAGADLIVTRNAPDFRSARVAVQTPRDFLRTLRAPPH